MLVVILFNGFGLCEVVILDATIRVDSAIDGGLGRVLPRHIVNLAHLWQAINIDPQMILKTDFP